MYKFLFTILPTNDMGLLTRSLPIAFELKQRGHDVVFSNPAQAPRKLIADAGFVNAIPRHPFFTLDSKDMNFKGLIRRVFSSNIREEYGSAFRFLSILLRAIPFRLAESTKEVWDTDHAAAIMGMMNKGFAKTQCDAAIEMMKEIQPDAVVDFWNPVTSIAARALKIPLVTVNQADAHPKGKGFIWWKQKPEGVPSAIPVLNEVMKGYGLDEISKLEDLNVGDLTLLLGIPETDPLPENADCTYIGPVLWQKPDDKIPGWFDDLDPGKPVIWLYPGNLRYSHKGEIFDSEVVLKACIDVLSKEDVQVVLTTGHHAIPEEYLPLPENFRVEEYVPGLFLAERCDLMINHGGYGSYQTSLYCGTPSLVIPTFSERESNARRMAALGAGEFVLPEKIDKKNLSVNPEELRSKIRLLFNDEKYQRKIQVYSRKLKSVNGAETASDLIEQYLSGNLN
ncbi:MAG: hypothetical protein GY863_12855 [bacterium]|nr:hypothetical protein [bacterium]